VNGFSDKYFSEAPLLADYQIEVLEQFENDLEASTSAIFSEKMTTAFTRRSPRQPRRYNNDNV
jgi:hypothetical protein